MNRPRIIVYSIYMTETLPVPNGMRYAAAMASDGRPGSHWLCTADAPEAARAKLEEMWDKAYPPKRPGPKKRAESVVEEPVL